MKIAALVARYLLGIMFFVFGLNGFLHFLKQPPPTGLALTYVTAMGGSHIMDVVYALQRVGGILLLAGRFVPIALTLLGPVIANILLYHLTMDPKGIPPGLVALILWGIVFYSVRSAFAGIFAARVDPEPVSAARVTA